jgi:hypothetical protein
MKAKSPKQSQKIVKRIISLTEELDKWAAIVGKKKPFTTKSQYIRAVLQVDYDNYKKRLSSNTKSAKKS